jgi:transposase
MASPFHADAEAAARAVLAGEAAGMPKSADGEVEMIRVLRATRRAAVKAREPKLPTSSETSW